MLRQVLIAFVVLGSWGQAAEIDYFDIQVIDAKTRRGVPLVELITVHDVRYITDNAGRIAYPIHRRGGETIFFRIEAQGYRPPKDGFGIEGARFVVTPGGRKVIELERINLAERLYRVTGQDQYLDSDLLGHKHSFSDQPINGMVSGQDSVQSVTFNGKHYWFWGDTNRLSYPLGLFRTAGATSPLPAASTMAEDDGVELSYFCGPDGYARAMVDAPNSRGVVWIDGVCVVPDANGHDHMVAHFSRRQDLATELEQGTCVYNVEREVFEVAQTYPLNETWRHVADHPIHVEQDGGKFLTWGNPFPVMRVPATLEAVLDQDAYEAFSCESDDSSRPQHDSDHQPIWQWQSAHGPTTHKLEQKWLRSGAIQQEDARFLPADVHNVDDRILMHSGMVTWNEHRKAFVMVAVQNGFDRKGPSSLGEVWFAESTSPQGPYRKAIKVVTHDRQTFYNPCIHPEFSGDTPFLYFEGTYCNSFTNAPATQRYNYNQMMYRLDLQAIDLDALRN